MQQRIIWERLDAPGLEQLDLSVEPEGVTAEGIVVTALEDGIFRLTYRVRCDAAWRFREGLLTLTREGVAHELTLAHGGQGDWRVNGKARPDLVGCTDIDIMASPFTNTLPIRRAPPAAGESRRYQMAYIVVPDLILRVDEQEYTRLDSADPPRRFRYHGLGSGFVAELEVDESGLVTAYEGIWRRR